MSKSIPRADLLALSIARTTPPARDSDPSPFGIVLWTIGIALVLAFLSGYVVASRHWF